MRYRNAQKQLAAKHLGHMVEICIKQSNDKRGSWTALLTVLNVNSEAGLSTVLGASKKHVTAAFEDVRRAVF